MARDQYHPKNRRAARPAPSRPWRRGGLHRRLTVEAIEDRILLSAVLPSASTAGQNAVPLSLPLLGVLAPSRLDVQPGPSSGYLDITSPAAGIPGWQVGNLPHVGNSAAVAFQSAGGSYVVCGNPPSNASGWLSVVPAASVPNGTPFVDYSDDPSGGPLFLRIVGDPVTGQQLETPAGPPSQSLPTPAPPPGGGLLAGGLIDTTPRAGDPVRLTGIVSGPAATAPAPGVLASPGGEVRSGPNWRAPGGRSRARAAGNKRLTSR